MCRPPVYGHTDALHPMPAAKALSAMQHAGWSARCSPTRNSGSPKSGRRPGSSQGRGEPWRSKRSTPPIAQTWSSHGLRAQEKGSIWRTIRELSRTRCRTQQKLQRARQGSRPHPQVVPVKLERPKSVSISVPPPDGPGLWWFTGANGVAGGMLPSLACPLDPFFPIVYTRLKTMDKESNFSNQWPPGKLSATRVMWWGQTERLAT